MLWSLTQVAAEGGRPRKKLSMAKCSIRSRTLLKSLKYLSVASPALRCHFSIGSLSVGLRSHHRHRLSDELNPSLLSSLLFTLEYLFLSSLCISVHSVCAAPCKVGFKCLSHWSSGMSWSSITDSKRVKNRSGSCSSVHLGKFRLTFTAALVVSFCMQRVSIVIICLESQSPSPVVVSPTSTGITVSLDLALLMVDLSLEPSSSSEDWSLIDLAYSVPVSSAPVSFPRPWRRDLTLALASLFDICVQSYTTPDKHTKKKLTKFQVLFVHSPIQFQVNS